MEKTMLIPEARAHLSNFLTRDDIERAYRYGITITGRVIDFNPKEQYLSVDLENGIMGIMPWTESTVYEWTFPKSYEISTIPNQILSLICRKVRVKVKRILNDGTIILSRKNNMLEAWDIIRESENMLYDAVVVGKFAHGAFFDIAEGLTAFCHVTNFSKTWIHRLGEWIFMGSSSKVKLLNKDSIKMICSRKDAYLDPKYQCSAYHCLQIVKVKIENPVEEGGKITGYHVEVNPNIIGIADANSEFLNFRYGDEVLAFIKSIDETKNRMKLRLIGS